MSSENECSIIAAAKSILKGKVVDEGGKLEAEVPPKVDKVEESHAEGDLGQNSEPSSTTQNSQPSSFEGKPQGKRRGKQRKGKLKAEVAPGAPKVSEIADIDQVARVVDQAARGDLVPPPSAHSSSS